MPNQESCQVNFHANTVGLEFAIATRASTIDIILTISIIYIIPLCWYSITSYNRCMPKRKHNPEGGRPTKCTQRLIDLIVPMLLAGNYLEVACSTVSIDKETLYNWLRRGHTQPRSVYRRFRDAVLEAQSRYEANALANIERAAKGTFHAILLKDENGNQLFDQHGQPLFIKPQPPDWQAEAWRLERKFSQRWTKTERQEISTNQGPVVQITLPSNTRELPALNTTTEGPDALSAPSRTDDDENKS